MIKVFYYYYYLFYTKILPDDQPHATVIFTLGLSFALIIVGISNITLAHTIGYILEYYQMFCVLIFMMLINYLLFYRNGKAKKILEEKPKFFNNHKLSIVLTIVFCIISISFLFWMPIYVKNILHP